ncbi:hypothetical protein ACFW61_36025 [Streptomyces microflavus]|uniref:hypothetical protein n=1 Tax=Streptomyces microflavus TaxID=1919 RepID=UPI003676FD93
MAREAKIEQAATAVDVAATVINNYGRDSREAAGALDAARTAVTAARTAVTAARAAGATDDDLRAARPRP